VVMMQNKSKQKNNRKWIELIEWAAVRRARQKLKKARRRNIQTKPHLAQIGIDCTGSMYNVRKNILGNFS
jgi:hypothetical protein